jgi:hypothetical protein
MTFEEEVSQIKLDTFESFKGSRRVWIVEERGADFIVHAWLGNEAQHGPGVAPTSSYPTLRKAVARLMQLFAVGPVAPQTWPEEACIGTVSESPQEGAVPHD